MRKLFIVPPLVVFSIMCASVNASKLTPWKKENQAGNSMTAFGQSSSQSLNRTGNLDHLNFSNATETNSMKRMQFENDYIEVTYKIRHMGNDYSIPGHLNHGMQQFLETYQPGKDFNPSTRFKIEITEMDKDNISSFCQHTLNTFLIGV